MRGLHRGSLAAAGTVLVLCLPAAASGTNSAAASGLNAVRAASSAGRVSAPRPLRAMRWSRQSRVHALAARRAFSGPAVVGLDAGADARELAGEYGLSVAGSDPGLRAVVLDGDPTALGRLAAAIGVDTRVRYVSPPRRMTLMHDRDDPLSTTVDPRTHLPYEWAFEHLGVDRALNVTKGDPGILVGIVDTGFGPARNLDGKIASSRYFAEE